MIVEVMKEFQRNN
jgi:spore cortex formation protein SpoVR/YcgB (stage V sporulation)